MHTDLADFTVTVKLAIRYPFSWYEEMHTGSADFTATVQSTTRYPISWYEEMQTSSTDITFRVQSAIRYPTSHAAMRKRTHVQQISLLWFIDCQCEEDIACHWWLPYSCPWYMMPVYSNPVPSSHCNIISFKHRTICEEGWPATSGFCCTFLCW